MATKAEMFRTEQMRSAKPPKAKRPPRARRDLVVDTALPGVSATDRKAGGGDTAKRNASKSAARKGGAKLENSTNGKPSRKSTRGSSNRSKRTSNLQRKVIRESSSAKVRATRANAASQGKA
jgi:hypothetical protein